MPCPLWLKVWAPGTHHNIKTSLLTHTGLPHILFFGFLPTAAPATSVPPIRDIFGLQRMYTPVSPAQSILISGSLTVKSPCLCDQSVGEFSFSAVIITWSRHHHKQRHAVCTGEYPAQLDKLPGSKYFITYFDI